MALDRDTRNFGIAAVGAVVVGVVAWQIWARGAGASGDGANGDGANGDGPEPSEGAITPDRAIRFADSWAADHRLVMIRDMGLAVSAPIFSRIEFFVGQPPRLSQRFWDGLEIPGEYYYVEYEFLVADSLGGADFSSWLTVLINPFTGEKPLGTVYTGWTAGTLSRNFGL